ncbi:hypothetical protein NFI96_016132 [Prochilodus magdalenae]|nr:hypothetical protein NFI96_016132 [Prochilodus magdalenae]
MSTNLRRMSAGQHSLFYDSTPSDSQEVLTGYLHKSPPQSVVSKSVKSWKRRYFVLTKTDGPFYELKYYKDANKTDKPIGEINLYQISLFFLNPEGRPTWEWIQKNFRCSSSCVLYMRVLERDYFLIGESSTEMEGWFNAIFAALKARKHTISDSEKYRKTRSISEPLEVKTSYDDQDLSENKDQLFKKPPSPSVRRSAPESYNTQFSHYDYPKSFLMKTSVKSEDEEDGEEDDVEREKSETETDTGAYMDMASVRKVASEVYSDDDLIPQTQLNGEDKDSQKAYLNCDDKSGSTGLKTQVPQQSPEEKEICVSQEELKKNAIFSEEAGKPCVSDWKHIQASGPFHEGDRIVAINDLLTDSLEEVQTFLKRLSKDQVKLTILRQPGSRPLSGCGAE